MPFNCLFNEIEVDKPLGDLSARSREKGFLIDLSAKLR